MAAAFQQIFSYKISISQPTILFRKAFAEEISSLMALTLSKPFQESTMASMKFDFLNSFNYDVLSIFSMLLQFLP